MTQTPGLYLLRKPVEDAIARHLVTTGLITKATQESVAQYWGKDISGNYWGKILRQEKVAPSHIVATIVDWGYSMAEIIEYLPKPDSQLNSFEAIARENLARLGVLEDLMKSRGRDAAQIIAWSSVLPCSWEPDVFLRGHHASIFSTENTSMTDEAAGALQDAYNQYGKSARDRFCSEPRRQNVAFDSIMFESDLFEIANPLCSEYAACSRESRLSVIANMLALFRDVEASNSRLWLIGDESKEKLLFDKPYWNHRRIPWDSVVLLRDQSAEPTMTFWRQMPAPMTQISRQDADLAIVSKFISEAESACTMDVDHTVQVLTKVRELIDSVPLGTYVDDLGYQRHRVPDLLAGMPFHSA